MPRKKKTVDNIDDLILAAEAAGLTSIVEKAKGLKLLFKDLKKIR